MAERYSARKMLAYSTEQLKGMLNGTFTVLFEDGKELQMGSEEVIFCSHFWDIHRQLPWVPIISAHTVQAVTKNGLLNASTHIRLAERIFWFVMDTAAQKGIEMGPTQVDGLNEVIYRKSNDLYNYACTELEAEVASTDLDDYYELLTYPPIKAVLDGLEPSEASISQTYASITSILMNDPGLEDNPLIISARAGMVKMSQLLQCIVCRGYVTDIDSMIFPEPSMGSFVSGYKDWYSLLIDTRTAAKSLFFSAKLLRMTEYNSRKLQILCQSVQRLYPGDCGSTNYMHFKIKPDEFKPDGTLQRKGDLERFAGKYFLNEETGQLQELKPTDSQYLGKVLKFRSVLGGCQHPDPHGVCTVCFSSMGVIVPEHTNIGYMLVAALMQILSQSILSVKHIDSTSSSAPVALNAHQKMYLEVNATGKAYHFNRNLVGKKISLVISEDQIPTIASLQNITDFRTIVPDHFSELNMTLLTISDDDGYSSSEGGIPLDLSNERRNAFFTPEALSYIKTKGWNRNDRKQIEIDFSDWDNSQPFAALPQRHFNNADHAKDIADLIQGRSGTRDDRDKRRQEGSVIGYFYDLYSMVNSRLDVPACVLELIVYGASIRDSAKGDYRLPRAGTSSEMGLLNATVPNRSMGAAMCFEQHVRNLFQSTQGFDPKRTSTHPMDVFITPQEAVIDAERRGMR